MTQIGGVRCDQEIDVGDFSSVSSLFLDQMAVPQCLNYSLHCTYLSKKVFWFFCMFMFHNKVTLKIQVKIKCLLQKPFLAEMFNSFKWEFLKHSVYAEAFSSFLTPYAMRSSEHGLCLHWLSSLLYDKEHHISVWMVIASQKHSVGYQKHETFVCCDCK